jgi:hypothetical protein
MDITDNWPCSDAFTKRETAAEEMYIKQEEKAKYVCGQPRVEVQKG